MIDACTFVVWLGVTPDGCIRANMERPRKYDNTPPHCSQGCQYVTKIEADDPKIIVDVARSMLEAFGVDVAKIQGQLEQMLNALIIKIEKFQRENVYLWN